MVEKFLTDIGLSEKEAEVYTALLAVESASVLDLSKKTAIKRTTVYPVLKELMEKGLVREVPVDKKVEYQAEPPERLQTFIENQKTKLEEQSKILNEIVPRLKSISRDSGERPIIKYYEGREGILDSQKEYFLEDGSGEESDIYMVYPKDILEETFTPGETKNARQNRLNKKVKAHSIYTYSKGEIPSDETSERVKLENSNEYPILCDIGVYKDRVRIHTLGKKLSAIYIKNHDLAETIKTLIKLAMEKIKLEKK